MIKDIELIGLGNGLVDLMYQVEDIEIAELNLRKGEMLLVSTDEQLPIFQKFNERNSHKCSGGSAANTVIAFSQMGGKAAYKTVLGNDELGKFYAQEFEELGIILDAEFSDVHPTGTCVVLISPDSERTLHTALGATALFREENIREEIIARSHWLYLEGYKFSEESSTKAIFQAIEFAKKHNTKIAVTFSDVFITSLFKNNLMEVVKSADLLFCNMQEALSFTNTETPDDAFIELTKLCPNVVLTDGVNGSKIKWNGDVFHIPVYKTIAVDSTGAGDMFAGAFFYGILKTESPEIAGHLASFAASKIVSQFGARLATQMDELLAKIKSDFSVNF